MKEKGYGKHEAYLFEEIIRLIKNNNENIKYPSPDSKHISLLEQDMHPRQVICLWQGSPCDISAGSHVRVSGETWGLSGRIWVVMGAPGTVHGASCVPHYPHATPVPLPAPQ